MTLYNRVWVEGVELAEAAVALTGTDHMRAWSSHAVTSGDAAHHHVSKRSMTPPWQSSNHQPSPKLVKPLRHRYRALGCCAHSQGHHSDAECSLSRRAVLLGGAAAADLAGRLLLPQGSKASQPAPPSISIIRPSSALAQGFESRISEFTLPNGMHFLVLERHEAPVLSCMVHANVGAFDEEEGNTGMAHLLEHMAFKGSSEIGSKDWQREEPLLKALDEAFYELRDAREEAARLGTSTSRSGANLDRLAYKFRQLQEQAAQLSVPNAFGSLLQQEGGVGLNATTSQDETKYFVSLPSNKLELWFALEARRFQDPVFRELYSEKRVIAEERQLRLESSPMGKFQQQYCLRALGNNYRRPVIGFEEDVERMGRREVFEFFNRFYGPANITMAIVGDVSPERVRSLAEKYFGPWSPASSRGLAGDPNGYLVLPAGAELEAVAAAEPLPFPMTPFTAQSGSGALNPFTDPSVDVAMLPAAFRNAGLVGGAQNARLSWPASLRRVASSPGILPDRVFRKPSEAGPFCMLGFYRQALTLPDGVAIKVLVDVLSAGRTSRLVSKLVLGERKLLVASADSGFTGEKHAGLTLVYGRPAAGGRPEEAERLLRQELDLLIDEGPDAAELARVKKGTRAGLYGALQSNKGMADALATYHVLTGSWRGMLDEVESVSDLTPQKCREVAARLFQPDNCFRGYMDSMRATAYSA